MSTWIYQNSLHLLLLNNKLSEQTGLSSRKLCTHFINRFFCFRLFWTSTIATISEFKLYCMPIYKLLICGFQFSMNGDELTCIINSVCEWEIFAWYLEPIRDCHFSRIFLSRDERKFLDSPDSRFLIFKQLKILI